MFQLGKLDDEDGVFRGEADQHDEADLGEEVVFHGASEERDEGAEDGDGRAEEHGEGERPAFIHGRENEEDEEEGHGENHARPDALLRLFFLERHTHVVVAHLRRHLRGEDFFERLHGLCGAEAGGGAGVDLGAAEEVVAHREFRAGAGLDRGDGAERDHLPIGVGDEELAEIFGPRAELAFGLDEDLPLAAKAVEVVHEGAAHEGLERLVNVVEFDALLEHFVAIHLDADLRNDGQKRGADAGDLGPLFGRGHEGAEISGEEGDVFTGAILEDESDAPRGADAGNRRWRKGERDAFADLGQLAVQVRLDGLVLLLGRLAFLPCLERDEEERAVSIGHAAEQAEAGHGGAAFYAGRGLDDFFDLVRRGAGALERRGIGQLQARIQVALVFLGEESAGQFPAEKSRADGEDDEQEKGDHAFAHEPARDVDVALGDRAETAVEEVVEFLQRAGAARFRLEQQGAERGRQGERVERGDEHRDGDGDRELLV